MPTQIVPKMKYEAMLEEARFIINRITDKLGPKIMRIDLNYSPDQYEKPTTPSGWVQIFVSLTNYYDISIVWSPYSCGGDKLLWELTLMNGDLIVFNQDYPDVLGWLDGDDVLEQVTKISRY